MIGRKEGIKVLANELMQEDSNLELKDALA
jgi:hypothetical protein